MSHAGVLSSPFPALHRSQRGGRGTGPMYRRFGSFSLLLTMEFVMDAAERFVIERNGGDVVCSLRS